MRIRLLATVAVGLLSAACSSPYDTNRTASSTAPSPSTSPYYTPASSALTSEQACAEYGFPAGTVGFSQCVTRERAARASGRAPQGYAEARVTTDARNACSSYGLVAGTAGYDRCVSREIDARSYRAVSQAPVAYRTDQYGYRIDSEGYRVDSEGYRIDANGYRITQASYAAPAYAPAPVYAPAPGTRVDAYGRMY
jgi:hypothetical protein